MRQMNGNIFSPRNIRNLSSANLTSNDISEIYVRSTKKSSWMDCGYDLPLICYIFSREINGVYFWNAILEGKKYSYLLYCKMHMTSFIGFDPKVASY